MPKPFLGATVDFNLKKIDLYVRDHYISEVFVTLADVYSRLCLFDQMKLCPGIESKGDLLRLENIIVPSGKFSEGLRTKKDQNDGGKKMVVYFMDVSR